MSDSLEKRSPTNAASRQGVLDGRGGDGFANKFLDGSVDLAVAELGAGLSEDVDDCVLDRAEAATDKGLRLRRSWPWLHERPVPSGQCLEIFGQAYV